MQAMSVQLSKFRRSVGTLNWENPGSGTVYDGRQLLELPYCFTGRPLPEGDVGLNGGK